MRFLLLALVLAGCYKVRPNEIEALMAAAHAENPTPPQVEMSGNSLTVSFTEQRWYLGAPPGMPIMLGRWEMKTAKHAPVRILKRRLQVYISDRPEALGSFRFRTREYRVPDCIETCYLVADEKALAEAQPDEFGILTFEKPFAVEPDGPEHVLICDSRPGIPPQKRLGFTAAEVEDASLQENIVVEDMLRRHVPVELGRQNMDGNVPRIKAIVYGAGYEKVTPFLLD